MLKTTARSIFDELQRRSIEVEIIDASTGLIGYRSNGVWHYVSSSTPASSSAVGAKIANSKQATSKVAESIKIKTPLTAVDLDDSAARDFLQLHKQVVVKPTDGAHGNGVTTDIMTVQHLETSIASARLADSKDSYIMQNQVDGDDVRILIINGKFTAAAMRRPAEVHGDGIRTLRSLIQHENKTNTERGLNYTKTLNVIDIVAAEQYLGVLMDTVVPESGEVVRVTGPANIGTGGTAYDVTERIPEAIRSQSEAIASEISLSTLGVDFMAVDIDDPETYAFIEANSCPSFGLHLSPHRGDSQPVDRLFVDYLLEV